MVTRVEIALKLRIARERRESRLKDIRRKRQTRKEMHIRPKIRANVKKPLYIDTKYNVKNVKKIFRSRMDSSQWSYNPLIRQVIPYKKGVEAEYKLVRWVERGIHPFSGINYGSSANRSVFDYLSDQQLDLAIKLSNEYKLKTI